MFQWFRSMWCSRTVLPHAESEKSENKHEPRARSNSQARSLRKKVSLRPPDIVGYLKLFFHSVRGPLNNAVLGLDILLTAFPNTDPNYEILQNVAESCTFVSTTLDNFVAIRAITCPLMSLSVTMAPFNMDGMMRQIQCLVLFDVMEKQIYLQYTPASEMCPWVTGDEHNLKQVIVSLLQHAIEHASNKASIHLTLAGTLMDGNRQMTVVTVTDENPYRQDLDTDPQWHLATTVVQLHGGRLTHAGPVTVSLRRSLMRVFSLKKRCTSVPDLATPVPGNVYTIEMPLQVCNQRFMAMSEGESNKSRNRRATIINQLNKSATSFKNEKTFSRSNFVTQPPLPPRDVERLTISVVDDSEMSRKMLLQLIGIVAKTHGTTVETLQMCDGLDAIVKLHERISDISIIFMDNMMPTLAGPLTAKLLRALGYQNLLIGITGNSMEDDVAQFYAGGIDFLFTKPFKKAHLDALWQLVLQKGASRHAGCTLIMEDGVFVWKATTVTVDEERQAETI